MANDADATFAAVRDGSALQSAHLDRLRDLIAVHHARSIQYHTVFEDNRLRASQEAQRFWQQFPTLLDTNAASRLGLPGGDADSRERAFREMHRLVNEWIADGALFDVMMESRYRHRWRTCPSAGISREPLLRYPAVSSLLSG